MSYESEVNSSLGEIFGHCGYSTSETENFWSTSAAEEAACHGKKHGLQARETAMNAFCQALQIQCEKGRMTRKKARSDLDSLVDWAASRHPGILARTVSATIRTREQLLVLHADEIESKIEAGTSPQFALCR